MIPVKPKFEMNKTISITLENVAVKQLVAVVKKIDILYKRLFKVINCYEYSL